MEQLSLETRQLLEIIKRACASALALIAKMEKGNSDVKK